MMIPQLLYAENPDGSGEIVCAASLVPTFDPVAEPQDILKVVKNEQPESMKLAEGSDFHFTFLVDRSGSMKSKNRMQIAIDSLTLFMRSLPEGCKFTIIYFGSEWSYSGDAFQVYNNETRNKAIEQIQAYRPDCGGTNIRSPLRSIYDHHKILKTSERKTIFILTDGCVGDADEI